MKVYSFGAENAPVILLLPGTCCHWKGNFGRVIPLLSDRYRVLCVSYDSFDETEHTEFPTMLEETEKIESYIQEHCGGHFPGELWLLAGRLFLWGCWRRGRIFIWITEFSAALILTKHLPLRQSCNKSAPAADLSVYSRRTVQESIAAKTPHAAKVGNGRLCAGVHGDARRRTTLCDRAELQESVLFRPCHPAAGQDRRPGNRDPYFLRPQDGRKIPRPL